MFYRELYMNHDYPQLTVGTTLLSESYDGERRRVFAQHHTSYLEVGEITCGPLTQELYDVPAHFHSVHLSLEEDIGAIKAFFADSGPYLTDFMDVLDAEGTPYGYLGLNARKCVSYRPPTS